MKFNDGHSPKTCNYRVCNAESEYPCPFLAEESPKPEGTVELQNSQALANAGDQLAFAAARVVTEYDGIHRLRSALSVWYDVRAGMHGNDSMTEQEPENPDIA